MEIRIGDYIVVYIVNLCKREISYCFRSFELPATVAVQVQRKRQKIIFSLLTFQIVFTYFKEKCIVYFYSTV